MSESFEDQGGAASSNPPALLRWGMSKVLSRIATAPAQAKRRAKAEAKRRKEGRRHRIEYFHQVEDGYSHLAAQLLGPLAERYDVELVCHLVRVPRDANLPEPGLLLPLSRYDSAKVAPHYGLSFPDGAGAPDAKQVDLAERILAGVSQEDFAPAVVAVGTALWSGDIAELDAIAGRVSPASRADADRKLEEGTARRSKLGHYSAGMFHCEGEWYWGADRFYHLEERLAAGGADKQTDTPDSAPDPTSSTARSATTVRSPSSSIPRSAVPTPR